MASRFQWKKRVFMLQSETSAWSGIVSDDLPQRIFPSLCLVLDRIG